MKNIFTQKISIGILIFFVIIIMAISFIFSNRQRQFDQPFQYSDLPIDRQLGDSGWLDIGIYTNKTYGYSFQYPARYLKVFSENHEAIWVSPNASAPSMVSPFSFGSINVFVSSNPPFISVDEWLQKNNKWYQFEKKIKIAGYDALIAIKKPVSSSDCKDNKIAILFKETMLFQIETCSINHERIWENFKFL